MAENILSQIHPNNLYRVTIDNNVGDSMNVDYMVSILQEDRALWMIHPVNLFVDWTNGSYKLFRELYSRARVNPCTLSFVEIDDILLRYYFVRFYSRCRLRHIVLLRERRPPPNLPAKFVSSMRQFPDIMNNEYQKAMINYLITLPFPHLYMNGGAII